MSFNILGHYENLHNIINNPVLMNKISMCPTNKDTEPTICGTMVCGDIYTLGENDFKCYLTPKDENIIAKQVTYLKNINATIIDMNESNESNVVETLKSTITKEKKLVNAFNGIIIGVMILVMIIIVIIAFATTTTPPPGSKVSNSVPANNPSGFEGFKASTNTILTTLSIIGLLIYICFISNEYSNHKTNKLTNEYNKIESIGNNIDTSINTNLTSLKTQLDNMDLDNITGNNYTDNIGNISGYLNTFNKDYIKEKEQLTNNKLVKEKKLNEINHLFTDFKHIIYKQENNFKDVIVDNSTQIHCLMNLIINRKECSNEIEAIKCSLNNKCGIEGLIDVNSKSGFNNNIGDILKSSEEIDIFFNKLKKETFNKNIKYDLNNLTIFKVIKNIFVSKIYLNEIDKHEFVKYIYDHFDKIDLKKENIEISKFNIISNYKTFINIIYNDYEIYKKTKNKNNTGKIGNIVNKSTFNNIIKYYNTEELEDIRQKLIHNIHEIEIFKNIYKDEIFNDINSSLNSNKYIKYASYFLIAISIIEFIKYTILGASDDGEGDLDSIVLLSSKILRNLSLIVLLNIILFSYWYKKEAYLEVQKLIITDNNNTFSKNLKDLQNKLKNMISVKKIKEYDDNSAELEVLLNIYNIKSDTKNDKRIFSKQNSGDNYTILDEDDIVNIVTEDFYNSLKEVMGIYECCSFLNKNTKVILFPWTDFTINIIFIAIIFAVFMLAYPHLQKKLKDLKKKLNQGDGSQAGGGPEEDGEIILNMVVFILAFYYTYNIYWSTMEHQKNLYRF